MDAIGLIPQFGGLIYTIGAFVLALSIIVAVHEYGHYIVGRWSGIHAEVFSVGFGPVIWSRTDKRGTKWQIAALPFGGYVKFLGDASAVSDRADDAVMSQLDSDERRHTMHGAPLWARAATVAAGPAFNFILSFLVFATIILFRGTVSEPLTVEEIRPGPYAVQELQSGDRILAINGTATPPLEDLTQLYQDLPLLPAYDYAILRDGQERVVQGPHPYPPIAAGISPGSAAIDAGIAQGDVIMAVNGDPVIAFFELRDIVQNSDGAPLTLDIWRDGDVFTYTLEPRRVDLPRSEGGFETRWLMGITGGSLIEPAKESPGLWGATQYGVSQTLFIIESSLSGLYHMAIGAISTCNLQGPIGIAETSGQAASQGWLNFVWFIAVLSTAVGLLNLFPIPVLDGGHLVFHAWEAATGNPPSDGALRVLMGAGITLMVLLMGFALTNDIFCP